VTLKDISILRRARQRAHADKRAMQEALQCLQMRLHQEAWKVLDRRLSEVYAVEAKTAATAAEGKDRDE
jgi:uncharacterized protein (DUF927 family)